MDAQTKTDFLASGFTTKSGRARGWGATVAYDTLRACGGFIDVSSEPARGTCVDLHFPVPDDTTEPVSVPGDPPKQPRVPKVLVVDDDDMVRMATQRMLAHLGYESMSAANGEEALELYRQSASEIAAVILDVRMPGLGGMGTFRRLREIDSQVRVIIYTGDPHDPVIAEFQAEGISAVLPKPFLTEQLAAAVEQASG